MDYYVYILKSESHKNQIYIGYTTSLIDRLKSHTSPKATAYTRRYAPWKLETYTVFKNKNLAQDYELYLKSQSGRAFLRKRLLSI